MLFYILLFVVSLVPLRLYWVLRRGFQQSKSIPLCVMVVLGSGGHTSEMFGFIESAERRSWADVRPIYVIASTDADSLRVAEDFESKNFKRVAHAHKIPRAREVGQSYFTSIFSTIKALLASFSIVWSHKPDVILTNGPGVCIPVVGASIIISALALRGRPALAYFESFTCVDHLSLSGKIMLRLADVFTVQWKEIQRKLSREDVINCGVAGNEALNGHRNLLVCQGKKASAVVTVGSTCFDELMAAIDSPQFVSFLERLHVTELLVQKGRSPYTFTYLKSDMKVEGGSSLQCSIVEYKPHLKNDIAEASLLISHAGAGTILEALKAGVPTIVVPNERLMSNHQVQLAKALHEERFLYWLPIREFTTQLPQCALDNLVEFPGVNTQIIQNTLRTIGI